MSDKKMITKEFTFRSPVAEITIIQKSNRTTEIVKLWKFMKRNTGERRSLDYLFQLISIAIQRGNSVRMRNTSFDRKESNLFPYCL